MSPLFTEIARGLFTLVAVAAGSTIALWMYFRQKEYELMKQRYLEGAVDAVAAQLEASFGVVSHNFARCLQVVKSFRDTGDDFDVKELERGFLELDQSRFLEIAHHRIGTLIGSQIVWQTFQSAMAYTVSANAMFTQEIPEAMRLRCTTTRIALDPASMGRKMANDLREIHQAGFKFATLTAELHFLSRLLELERLSIKAVAKFQARTEVKKMVQRLQVAYSSENTVESD